MWMHGALTVLLVVSIFGLGACGGTAASSCEGRDCATPMAEADDAPPARDAPTVREARRAPAKARAPRRAAPPPRASSLERAAVAEINRLRADPRAYAAVLREVRGHYRGKRLELPGKVAILTAEGVRAVDEAIAALRRAKPVGALRFEAGLHAAARAHVADIGPRGALDHVGRDGSTPTQRMERHGRVTGLSGENLDFGFDDPRMVVVHLLIDDGVPDRGHRKNLLDPSFRHVGVACGPHRAYRVVCVMDFAEGYRGK